MNKSFVILRKELQSYFRSPLAYIILVATVGIFNIFFFMIIDQNNEATLRDMFKVMEFMFIFIIPLLTMKSFAEEKAAGTMEFLMTTPTKDGAIVLGKYLGSLAFVLIMITSGLIYYAVIEYFGHPDRGAVLSGFVGIILEAALFTAVGIMTSSWTKNQIVAAMSSYVILFLLYFTVSLVKYFHGVPEATIKYLGTWSHMEGLSAGLINASDLVYYLSGIVFCLLMTRLSLSYAAK